ncbi:hypothetical protein Plec18170_007933 [Paecilomyces lecythidis]
MFQADRQIEIPTKDILSFIFDNPDYDQDKPIYVDVHNPSRSISGKQARLIVRQLIAGFRAAGVQKGDCIAIHSFNDILYCMLVLAIIGVGGVYTGTNPAYTAAELGHHIKTSKSKFLISEPEILDPLLAAAKEHKIPRHHIWVFTPLKQQIPGDMQSWKELLKSGEEDWIRFDDLDTARTTTAARLFSSGTTGLPKATTITHYNLVAQHELTSKAHPPRPYPTHEKYGVTEVGVVPPIVIAIVMSPYSKTRPFMKTVRYASCGAAPLDKEIQARFLKLLADDAACNQVWGMTETSCIATMLPYTERDDTGSIGRLIPNLEAKLIDDDGRNISAYGVRGEICVRGPTITPGYFGNDKANTDSFDADGWFKTGDIGYCDEATRKWYIVDRKKELIKVRGFQVAPPELEAVLLSHPQIIDAAVVGITLVRDDGEVPRAYVVRRPGPEGAKVTEKDVKVFLESRLAKYKALTGGVKFVDSIARNASGKILKRLLREDCEKDLKAGRIGPKL